MMQEITTATIQAETDAEATDYVDISDWTWREDGRPTVRLRTYTKYANGKVCHESAIMDMEVCVRLYEWLGKWIEKHRHIQTS